MDGSWSKKKMPIIYCKIGNWSSWNVRVDVNCSLYPSEFAILLQKTHVFKSSLAISKGRADWLPKYRTPISWIKIPRIRFFLKKVCLTFDPSNQEYPIFNMFSCIFIKKTLCSSFGKKIIKKQKKLKTLTCLVKSNLNIIQLEISLVQKLWVTVIMRTHKMQ